MLKWLIDKIQNINSIVDLSIIISVIGGITLAIGYIYKIAKLKLIGVPFEISFTIVDLTTKDIIFTFIVSVLFLFGELLLYKFVFTDNVASKLIVRLVTSIVVLCSVCIIVCIYVGFTFDESSIIALDIITSVLIGMFCLNKAMGDEVDKQAFEMSDEYLKIITAIINVPVVLFIVIVFALINANIVLAIPMNKVLVNDRFVIYSSENYFYTSDYSIYENRVVIDLGELEIVSKENAILTTTSDKLIIDKNLR